MKLSFTTIVAFATPLYAQSLTPAPTKTDNWGPPWATSDAAKWSSIYASLVSDGKIPSTLTAAPWPTDGYGPGAGWGPGGGGRGPGGPGGHWGGTCIRPHLSHFLYDDLTPNRTQRSWSLGIFQLRPLLRLVDTFRLAQRALDSLVG